MGKVTKIMLGLNILAGIAGIVFGMGVKGDLKTATDEKQAAVAKAAEATGGTSKLQQEKQKLSSDFQITQGDLAEATKNLTAANDSLAALQGGQGQMAQDLQLAQADNATLQSQLTAAQGLAEEAKDMKKDFVDYEALGTPADLRKMKKRLEKIDAEKAVREAKNKEPKDTTRNNPKPGAEIGAIASYDPKFNFYVINRGADHGVKAGDEFNVLRGGNLVGKIKIKQTQPTVSIADAVKEFTRQQLQAGDKVAKAN